MPTQTSTSSSSPWVSQQPYLRDVFSKAQRLQRQGGPRYYPGDMTAGLGQDTQAALGMFRNQAQAGSPMVQPLNQMMSGTLAGDYLNSNPYLDAVYDRAADAVTRNYREGVAPGIDARFDSAGRFGSGMWANQQDAARQQLGRQLGGMASNLYGQNYANERANQMKAAALAPSTMPMSYFDAQQMLNVGNVYDQQRQTDINADYQRHMFNQERPWDALGRYSSLVQGNYGGQGTQTTPYFQDNTMRNLGIGLMGAGFLGSAAQNGLGNTLSGLWNGLF
jgi:hypothetical protein